MALARVRIERILCPTDFSEFSERALRRAVALARWFEATVTVLHVIQPLPWVASAATDAASIMVPEDLLRRVRDALAKGLEDFVTPFRADAVPIEALLHEGDASSEIQVVAEALHADLVVIGTHGRGRFDHLLLGSVTEKVLRRLPCPVLAVGSADSISPASPLFHRILCATDLTSGSKATLDMALSVAAESMAKVTLLHVVGELIGEGVRELYRPIPELAPLQKALVDQAKEQLIEAGRPARDYCEVIERVETGKAWHAILRVAEQTQADLVVMGARSDAGLGRLFLGSTANQVVRRAVCPVFIVRQRQALSRHVEGTEGDRL
jgi:nucleotide-binding universal stress UspA family protein